MCRQNALRWALIVSLLLFPSSSFSWAASIVSLPTTSSDAFPSSSEIASVSGPLVVPGYSSLPGAPHTLYLDFDGIDYSGNWSGRTPGNVPAYNIDGDATTFSDTELANIQEIWTRVSEMYSPFNVNITTVPPGTTPVKNQWSQIIVAAENFSGSDWYGVAGGVAMAGGFKTGGMQSGTGWAFTNYLGNGNPKYTAIAAAHEAGHQFGLQHQKQYDSNGKLVEEYRPSLDDNLTAPIMGKAYYSVRGLWSNGTSASATRFQDDLSILATTLGYRPDEDNHDFAHAALLAVSSKGVISASGVIKQTTESDFYGFTTDAAQVSLTAAHFSPGGMLDAKLLLYAEDGTLLQSIDPDLTLTGPDYGLDATFTGELAAGRYYIGIASHGSYGDIGQYSLSGTFIPVPEPEMLVLLSIALAAVWGWKSRS